MHIKRKKIEGKVRLIVTTTTTHPRIMEKRSEWGLCMCTKCGALWEKCDMCPIMKIERLDWLTGTEKRESERWERERVVVAGGEKCIRTLSQWIFPEILLISLTPLDVHMESSPDTLELYVYTMTYTIWTGLLCLLKDVGMRIRRIRIGNTAPCLLPHLALFHSLSLSPWKHRTTNDPLDAVRQLLEIQMIILMRSYIPTTISSSTALHFFPFIIIPQSSSWSPRQLKQSSI